MKKYWLFLVGILLAGLLAYWGSYYFYMSNRTENTLKVRPVQSSRSAVPEEKMTSQEEYYMAKIEGSMLIVYEMPEIRVYDSLDLRSFHFSEAERIVLSEGMEFMNLGEIFGFLESSMS